MQTPHSIDAYRLQAKTRLDPRVWQYLAEGDDADNENALKHCRLMPRPLRTLAAGHTRLNLFGSTLAHPIVLAPIAYQQLFHPEGEQASAIAASALEGQFTISSLASQSIESINHAAQGVQQGAWFQLYWQENRARTAQLLARAHAAGCSAIVFTVDAPIKLATLDLPPHIQAVNLMPREPFTAKNSTVFEGWMQQAPTWDDLAWLRQQTHLPLIIKGLLHPADIETAIEMACDGVVVSNHGGRVLAGAPISLSALKTVAEQVRGRIPVLFDSGIRSGRDVFVALAHGASAVLLGRPYIWGLASGGAMGVAHIIRLMRDELEMTMALTGCASLSDINVDCLSPY